MSYPESEPKIGETYEWVYVRPTEPNRFFLLLCVKEIKNGATMWDSFDITNGKVVEVCFVNSGGISITGPYFNVMAFWRLV